MLESFEKKLRVMRKGASMEAQKQKTQKKADPARSTLVELMLTDFDELIELDYENDRMRNLKHTDGKLLAPVLDASIRDIRRYAAENAIHPDDLDRYLAESDPETAKLRIAEESRSATGVHRARFRFKQLGGGWRWMEQIAVGGEINGVPEGVCYIFLYDVQHEMEQDDADAARSSLEERNELTGLLSKDLFFAHAKELLQMHSDGWCAVSIDLEHFKLFNEWYGRRSGDLLLSQTGALLIHAEERSGGLACYFGQDDFAVLIPYDKEKIERLYADIHNLIKGYGNSVGFMPAFGIAMADGANGAEELCDRAALAARYAKEDYHTRIRVFEESMYRQTERDYQILSDFQKALQEHELFIEMQPQCKISSHRIVGAESLVRWRKSNGEMVPPALFIPILERYGFITDLDKYVWEEVCIWQKKWIDGGHTPLPVSVNVSQIDIYAIDVPDFFDELSKKYELPVDVVKIEITESAYADNDAVADTVRRLRKKGFLVLMDDFGSGYSSLNMLRSLTVDIIKLDAHFLRMNGDDRRKGMQIMESIVNLAKTMGVPIIVEGVETEEETNFLIGLGCRYVQGYHFYRPMAVSDFEKLIADPHNIDTSGFLFKPKEQFHTREFLDQNVFSDTMLNNILGPAAFFSVRGKTVDIVRYNQQFANEINVPAFIRDPRAVQKYVVMEDVQLFYNLFKLAELDPLSGAGGVVRFNREDGSLLQLQLQLFFLETDDSGKRFYGSAHDITQVRKRDSQMQLLSRVSPDSVVFLGKRDGEWYAQVAIHGLVKVLGINQAELEYELNDRSFFNRIAEADRKWLFPLVNESGMRLESFSPPFLVTCADGSQTTLRVGIDHVQDENSGVEYLMILRQVVDGGQ
ncbi:MAG: EAL domain-containing protein [Ruminococcaceae bacterium]|nr:EAL domain-containing protein [Oscillospiraceae bacterium]